MKGRFHFKEENLFQLINTYILGCIFLLRIGGYLGIEQLVPAHYVAAFGGILLLAGINFLPVKGKAICLLSIGIFAFVGILTVGITDSFSFLQSYFRWLLNSGAWNEKWIIGYEFLQVLFVTLICYAAQILIEKYIFLKVGVGGLLVVSTFICLFSEIELSHIEVILIIFYTVLIGAEWIQIHWVKNKRKSAKAYMIWIMPFIAIYLVVLLIIPVPEKPYDWKWAKNIYQQTREAFLRITQDVMYNGREDFEMSMSGFTKDASIGGDFAQSSREMMTIQSKNNLITNVYLTGAVYDTFDGRDWEQSKNETASSYLLDTLEMSYAARKYNKSYFNDYLRIAYLDIYYQHFRTDYLFIPLKLRNITENSNMLHFSWENDDPLFTESKGYGTEYHVEYYQMNADMEEFYNFLGASDEPEEQEWEEILKYYRSEIGEGISLEDVKDYRNKIDQLYLKEVTLSDPVREYLNEITKNADSDIEKLRAIEQELSAYTYTNMPGELPDTITDESTFLDYFLLNSRQGYCTYFATSFVLLARAEGFPARYVQGFCVPMKGKKEVIVSSDMAHAWPEVYLEGVGWIPFEPTPGYAQMRYTPWKMLQRIEGNQSSTNDKQLSAYYENLHEQRQEESELAFEAETTAIMNKGIWKILAYSLLFIFAGSVVMLLLDNLISRHRYNKMDNAGKFMAEVAKNMTVLAWLKFARTDEETLQEFKVRLEGTLYGKDSDKANEIDMLQFITDYEELLYGEKHIDTEQINLVKKDRKMLLELCKNKRKPAYIYSRLKWY